jgi:hypothetical protein
MKAMRCYIEYAFDPLLDFPGVCGDIDIPWATEKGKETFDCYRRTQALTAQKTG